MKTTLFKMIVLIILLIVSLNLSLSCGKTQKITANNSGDNIEYYSFLADSTGMLQTVFTVKQDVFFHFGIINTGKMPQDYIKCHGGPPIVSFEVFKNDSLVGTSDDGHGYPDVEVPGELPPGDTLHCFTSWYSNDYHDSLTVGSYVTRIRSYLTIEDIHPPDYLDSIRFEIILE